jgi:hypothetical protein
MATKTVNGIVIHTSFDYPPIPIRSFDWSAVTEDYDGAPDAGWQPVGHGETEEAAIADLLDQIWAK